MYIENLSKKIDHMNKLRHENDFSKLTLSDLQRLPNFNGVCELTFSQHSFLMLNIAQDDSIPIKYFWRKNYEKLSLDLWFKITREDKAFIDVGAHTGIYTIIGNLNKKNNHIISFEPYHLNFARLISNLKLNNISTNLCHMVAVSNENGIDKFSVSTNQGYHTQAGKICSQGNFNIQKIKIDNLNINKKIGAIKIDTEGHEFNVIMGSKNIIKKEKPDFLFEINESSFDDCINFLKDFGYKIYFIDEDNQKLDKVEKFSISLKKEEGTNCYATIK